MEIQPYNHLDQDNSENMLEPETTNIPDVTIVSDDERRSLTINQKRVLSKLYKLGDAIEQNEKAKKKNRRKRKPSKTKMKEIKRSKREKLKQKILCPYLFFELFKYVFLC